MKRSIVILLALLCGIASLSAQDELLTAEAQLPDSIKYVYPEFKSGLVILQDGTRSNGRFNISTWQQELLFIGNDGKIQALADNELVKWLTIDGKTYYYDKMSYIGVVDTVGDVMLCSSRKLVFDDATTGAYGMKSSTTATQTVAQYQNTTSAQVLFSDDTEYELKDIPYINRKNRFYTPTKKNLLKAFPNHEEAIEGYLKEHNVDFSSLKDLQDIFNFVKGL